MVNHPTLIVLDLNGLFIERQHVSKIENKHNYNFKTPNGYYVFVRPYTKILLKYLFDHFHVGVWSSMNHRNTHFVVDKLFSNTQKSALEFIMTQEHCYQTGELKEDGSPMFYKNLINIWKKPQFHKFYNHTLLIDDSESKSKYNPQFTSIHPTPFNHNYKNDKELEKVHKYLLNVKAYETVPFYVNIQPYHTTINKKDKKDKKEKKVRFDNAFCNENSEIKLDKYDDVGGHKAKKTQQPIDEETTLKSTCNVLMKTIVLIGGVKLMANIFSKIFMRNQYI